MEYNWGMKKILYLLLFIFVLFGASYLVYITKFRVSHIPPDEKLICETDEDCIPWVYECGFCPDYTISINKKYTKEYENKYVDMCGGNSRICASEPRGKSSCQNNRCNLIID